MFPRYFPLVGSIQLPLQKKTKMSEISRRSTSYTFITGTHLRCLYGVLILYLMGYECGYERVTLGKKLKIQKEVILRQKTIHFARKIALCKGIFPRGKTLLILIIQSSAS